MKNWLKRRFGDANKAPAKDDPEAQLAAAGVQMKTMYDQGARYSVSDCLQNVRMSSKACGACGSTFMFPAQAPVLVTGPDMPDIWNLDIGGYCPTHGYRCPSHARLAGARDGALHLLKPACSSCGAELVYQA